MENNNMTGENVPFTSGEIGYANYAQNSHHEEKREPKFGFWNLVLTLISLFSFFGCVYLYFDNGFGRIIKAKKWELKGIKA